MCQNKEDENHSFVARYQVGGINSIEKRKSNHPIRMSLIILDFIHIFFTIYI